MLTLGWRFSLAENADGADNLINPINLSEGVSFLREGVWVCNRAAVVRDGEVRLSPYSRLRRQCGVIEVVTAHAVNIADNQMARGVLRRSAEGA